MKKRFLLLIIMILVIPSFVNAKEKVYNICKSGCEYSKIIDVWSDINKLNDNVDVIVNFKDAGPYSFMDGYENYIGDYINADTYEVPLISGEDYYSYCLDGDNKIDLDDEKVYDYNTSTHKCLLIKGDEKRYKTSPYIYNSNINSVTINGYDKERTVIDIVGAGDEDSILHPYARLFFMGAVNTKLSYFKNLDIIGSFYGGSELNDDSIIIADNCNFRYGILTYGVKMNITNSNINRVYSLFNSKVYIDPESNEFNANGYRFITKDSIPKEFSDITTKEDLEEWENLFKEYIENEFKNDNKFDFTTATVNNAFDMIMASIGSDNKHTNLMPISGGEIIIMNNIKNLDPNYKAPIVQVITNPKTSSVIIIPIILISILVISFKLVKREENNY